jgi:hypothetical protein
MAATTWTTGFNFRTEGEEEDDFIASGEPLEEPIEAEGWSGGGDGDDLTVGFLKAVQDLPIEQWAKGKNYSIKLSLSRSSFSWQGGQCIGDRRERILALADILMVDTGKGQRNNFGVSRSEGINEDFCLSLITKDSEAFSLVASSKLEREALAEGFADIIDRTQDESGLCVVQ